MANSEFKNFTRGSQTTFHNFRMFTQGVRRLFTVILFSILISNSIWMWLYTDSKDWLTLKRFGTSTLHDAQHMILRTVFGQQKLNAISDYNRLEGEKELSYILDQLYTASLLGLGFAFFINVCFWTLLTNKGKQISDEKRIRGSELTDNKTLKQILNRRKIASKLKIGGIPVVKDSEVQHIMISGSTGTGKTVCISNLLEQIREKGQRAIVYDKMGAYTERFYREGKDVLLNPLDSRFPGWNIWGECTLNSDFDRLAESMIPMATTGQDPFWTQAARILFSVAGRKLANNNPSTKQLLHYLLMSDLTKLNGLFSGTEAESLVSEDAAKMALSVKAVLAVNLRAMLYLEDVKDPFSIKKWIQDEKDDSWLFITSREDQHATLTPLIATWLDVASSSILSLSPSSDRRIWLVLDEIGSLHRLPTLTDFLEQSRQFGGCGVLGFHTLSQFYKNFGKDCAEEILGVCNTGVHFRSTDKITADYVSNLIGEQELGESQESISYGANSMRDGISINERKSVKRLVLPTEIQQQDDLQAYLRLKGGLPVSQISFKYKEYEKISDRYLKAKSSSVTQMVSQENKASTRRNPFTETA